MATTTADGNLFGGWLRALARLGVGSESEATRPAPQVAALLPLLRPVFDSENEAALRAALDANAPEVLKRLESAPSRDDDSRDNYVRARMARGFEGEDAVRLDATFAMFLFCRDATRVLRELDGKAPEPLSKVWARASSFDERARAALQRAVRGIGAFAAITIAARCSIDLRPWQRKELVDAAWDVSRLGASGSSADLLQRGALPALLSLVAQHGVVRLLPGLRDPMLDELALRATSDPQRLGAYTRLSARIREAGDLPTYIGDHAAIFHDVARVALARLVDQAAGDWLSGERSPEAILRALGFVSIELMAALDAKGAGRPAERLRLSSSEREEILARLRADRLARNGEAKADAGVVIRDVAASQRIEGVDVRPLLFVGATHRS